MRAAFSQQNGSGTRNDPVAMACDKSVSLTISGVKHFRVPAFTIRYFPWRRSVRKGNSVWIASEHGRLKEHKDWSLFGYELAFC